MFLRSLGLHARAGESAGCMAGVERGAVFEATCVPLAHGCRALWCVGDWRHAHGADGRRPNGLRDHWTGSATSEFGGAVSAVDNAKMARLADYSSCERGAEA